MKWNSRFMAKNNFKNIARLKKKLRASKSYAALYKFGFDFCRCNYKLKTTSPLDFSVSLRPPVRHHQLALTYVSWRLCRSTMSTRRQVLPRSSLRRSTAKYCQPLWRLRREEDQGWTDLSVKNAGWIRSQNKMHATNRLNISFLIRLGLRLF